MVGVIVRFVMWFPTGRFRKFSKLFMLSMGMGIFLVGEVEGISDFTLSSQENNFSTDCNLVFDQAFDWVIWRAMESRFRIFHMGNA